MNNDRENCPVVIPYYGGKFTMSKQLLQYIPEHLRYFEPFFGGGSMFFRKNKVRWNILNDIDNDLVNLYICILDKFDELSEKIFWYPRSRKLHDDFREDIKATQEINIPDPTRAAKYFFKRYILGYKNDR
jgi:DNA adenine methylase